MFRVLPAGKRNWALIDNNLLTGPVYLGAQDLVSPLLSGGKMSVGRRPFSMKQLAVTVWNGLKQTSTEPLGFLTFFTFSALGACTPQAMRDKCETMYTLHADLSYSYRGYENFLQKAVIKWNLYRSLPALVPTFVSSVLFGSYSDKHGRKVNILIGTTGLTIEFLNMIIIFSSSVYGPLWLMPVVSSAVAFFGGVGVCFSAMQAFMADAEPDKNAVTIRMVIVSATRTMGSILGSLLTSVLFPVLGLTYWLQICMSIYVISFFWALYRIPHIPPKELSGTLKELAHIDDRQSQDSQLPLGSSFSESHGHIEVVDKNPETVNIREILHLYREALRVLTVKRHGHKKLMIGLLMLVFVALSMSLAEAHSLVGVYVLNPPLEWGASKYAAWRAAQDAMSLCVSTLGAVLMKKVLKLPETHIIFFGLASSFLSMWPLAFVEGDAYMWVAAALGSMSSVTMPAVLGFLNILVGPTEIGRLATVSFLIMMLGFLAADVALQPLYLLTVDWFPGFVFIVVAGLLFVAMMLVVVVHVLAISDNVFECNRFERFALRILRRARVSQSDGSE